MSVLLRLPEDVVHEVFHEWLEVNYMGMLDRALTSKSLRPMLILTLKAMTPLRFKGEDELGHNFLRVYNGNEMSSRFLINELFLRWIHLRGIRLRQLVLGVDVSPLGELRVQIDAASITQIAVLSSCRQNIATMYPYLELIEIKNEDVFCGLDHCLLKQISGLHLNIPLCKNSRTLDQLRLCENLSQLRLNVYFDDAQLPSIVMSCPLLVSVQLFCRYIDFLSSLFQYCASIECIHLVSRDLSQPTMMSTLNDWLPRRPVLRKLFIYTKDRIGTKSIQYCRNTKGRDLLITGYDNALDLNQVMQLFNPLSSIMLVGCTIKTEVIPALLQHSKSSLKSFKVDTWISEASLQSVIQCPHLENLSLQQAFKSLSCCCTTFSVSNRLKIIEVIHHYLEMSTVIIILQSSPCMRSFFVGCILYNDSTEFKSGFEAFVDLVHIRHNQYEDLKGKLVFDKTEPLLFERSNFAYTSKLK